MSTPDFTTYTRDHWTCLLDVEARAVDSEGMFGRMTEIELDAIQAFEADGLISGWTHVNLPIKLTDRGWAVAHAIRRARAERMGDKKDGLAVLRGLASDAAQLERARWVDRLRRAGESEGELARGPVPS